MNGGLPGGPAGQPDVRSRAYAGGHTAVLLEPQTPPTELLERPSGPEDRWPPPGRQAAGRRPGRRGWVAALAAAVLVALAGWLVARAGGGPARPPAAATSHRASPGPGTHGPAMVTVNAAALLGRPAETVRQQLAGLRLRPRVVRVATGRRPPGTAVSVQPSGRVAEGSIVTVTAAAAPADHRRHHGRGHEKGNGGDHGQGGGRARAAARAAGTEDGSARRAFAGPAAGEGAAVGLRAGVHGPAEVLAQVGRGGEAALLRHRVDRQVTRFQQPLGQLDALLDQPLVGSGAGAGQELPGERPGAHRRAGGQILDGDRLVQMFLQPADGAGEEAGMVEHRHRRVDVLSLAPLALGRDDELAGELGGDLGAVVLADHVQAQVDAGGAPGRGQDVALVNEQDAGIHRHPGMLACEQAAFCPVRGGAAAVEQPGGGQGERARAQRHDPAAPCVRLPQHIEHRGRVRRGRDGRQHDHRARGADLPGPVGRQDPESAVGGHRPPGEAAYEGAVPGNAANRGPLVAEDVAGHPQLEHGDPVRDHDGDRMPRTLRGTARRAP